MKSELQWFRYHRCSLLLLTFVTTIACGSFALRLQTARRQREAVAAILKTGGDVAYSCDFDRDGFRLIVPGPRLPGILNRLLGDDFFYSVVVVAMGKSATDSDIKYLDDLPGLRALGLSSTHCTDSAIRNRKWIGQLQWLGVPDAITNDGMRSLVFASQLRILQIGRTQIGDAGLESIGKIPSLEELYAAETRVTDSGLKHLKGLSRLRVLDVYKTKVTWAGVKELMKSLPDLDDAGVNVD